MPSRKQVAIALLIVLAVLIPALGAPRSAGYLDPGSAEPNGSRALANLLTDQGVHVVPVRRATDALGNAEGASVLITTPALVDARMVTDLIAAAPARVLVVQGQAEDPLLRRLAAGVTVVGADDDDLIEPGCALRSAEQAGSATLPGLRYDARSWDAQAIACYESAARAGVVELPRRSGRPTVVLIGSAEPLTNAGLNSAGNAALALNLLGHERKLVWWRPTPDDVALSGGATLSELIPPWVIAVVVQIFLACLLLAAWRGRRLGRLVIEPLPVVIRAGETASGHARLMQQNRARGEASAQLRAASRERLRVRAGLPIGSAAEEVITAAALRSGRSAGDVARLLYGPEATTDEDLVALDHDLRELTTEVGH